LKLFLEVVFLLATILFGLLAILLAVEEGFIFFLGGLVPTFICYFMFMYVKNR